MVVAHNMKAMNAERQLNIVTSDKAKSSEKLSSGYRINRSADDAAGLSISEKMRHQIRGLYRGANNIEEGVGYCQVADGALHEMQDMLQRMNELCIQAANGTLSNSDRGHIDNEIQVLKEELQRICDTTKFNEEYIFRCEDVIEEGPHDVYMLDFSGTPKDLFVYNSNAYDTYDDGQPYAGISYRGRRYTWEEISPYMYDKTTQTFREGEYAIKSEDDNTILTLVCKKDAKLPEVSRQYRTSADGRGVYVNNDFAVSWDTLEKTKAGNRYTFTYHGVQVSFTADPNDTFEDKVLKMMGTEWESTYTVPEPSKALDAYFTPYEYTFDGRTNKDDANQRIEYHVKYGSATKYILHAEDINNGGTIPYHGPNGVEYIPFDGVWIEETDSKWNPTNKPLWKMTWGEFKGITDVDKIKLDTIPGTDNFGFTCDEDSTKHDWSDLSTDIWVGNKTDDPNPYPPDMNKTGNDRYVDNYGNVISATVGKEHFAGYDSYNRFSFINTEDNNESVKFIFSVINEISKTQGVNALDGVKIGYSKPVVNNGGKIQETSGNITSPKVTVSLALEDEYYLGRDYEKWDEEHLLKDSAQLNYTGGGFSIEYAYDTSRRGGNLTYTMSSGEVDDMVRRKVLALTDDAVLGNPSSSTSISLSLNTSGAGSSMVITETYELAGFGSQNTNLREDNNGRYVQMNGRYYRYDDNPSYYQAQIDAGRAKRYSANLTGAGGVTMYNYLKDTVLPDMANSTTVSLHVYDYPKAVLGADENPNMAQVTRWQTPFQLDPLKPVPPEEEKPEYLRIQCSSNTIDQIYIQKQKLSVYRMGLMNVGTLSEAQATGCIDMVGAALHKVSAIRSRFGAYQNRLEHAFDINRNTHENTQSAESMIRDTDMAKEMIRFSNANILEQSGNSMLVQANQANNMVLSLLQ